MHDGGFYNIETYVDNFRKILIMYKSTVNQNNISFHQSTFFSIVELSLFYNKSILKAYILNKTIIYSFYYDIYSS